MPTELQSRILKVIHETATEEGTSRIARDRIIHSLIDDEQPAKVALALDLLADSSFLKQERQPRGDIYYRLAPKGASIVMPEEYPETNWSSGITATNVVIVNGDNLGQISQNSHGTLSVFTELAKEVAKSDLPNEEKRALLADVESINGQIKHPKPDKEIIVSLWERIKAAAQVATTAETLTKAGHHIADLIASLV